MSLRTFGRAMQVAGMIVLPFAIASELAGKVSVAQTLLIAGGGVALFYFGVVLQNRSSG